ncbi:hypothetical protein BS78_06G022100 [Paspalum vaginatum]|nr:hypothetical protein BS78_06G022100 [Paspalum vaginatum]
MSSTVEDPRDHVYSNIPENTHVLEEVPNCRHCGAKRFHKEPKGFCCRDGDIQLSNIETPPELMWLWTSTDSDVWHFRDSIRFFNGHFVFTSLHCMLDGDTINIRKSGVYTFRAHGQMYHTIADLAVSCKGGNPLEMYFYDDDPSLEHRYRHCRENKYQKDQEVIRRLIHILKDNPYSQQLKQIGQIEGLADYRITFNLDHHMDQRTHNVPLTSEVAAVWVKGIQQRRKFDCGVVLYGNNKQEYGIWSYHASYDPLAYPLFFPRGESGWHSGIPKKRVCLDAVNAACAAHGNSQGNPDSANRLCVSVRDYYCYKLQMRPKIFNPILFGKHLFQQFVVDTYIKIESSRLDYIWSHQKEIRADLYQGLMDCLHRGETRANAVGRQTVLPRSFIGGPRDMRRRYLDAMALVRKYGKPDIFLTMTCNPNWEEIKRELEVGQIPQDRPNLAVRVFRAKLEEMKRLEGILGKVQAYVYVVEFQKRGLPHAHFLLIMQGKYKLTCPKQYDSIISAELPNKSKYLELYKMVIKHMMHGTCRHELDNRWVVPYNPFLLRYFNCHINVEVCSSIKAVKYLYKYLYKGHDRASVSVNEADGQGNVDEIKMYREASKNSPPMMQLQLHLPGMHMVTYEEGQDIQEILDREGAKKNTLARGILYRDFLEYFTWQKCKKAKFWQKRKQEGVKQIGRIISAHPAKGERYFLRVLLNHVVGATSFEDLRTVDEKRGLIEADNTLDYCLTEAETFQMPSALRRLFVMILVHCEASNVRGLWDKHREAMSEDYCRTRLSMQAVQNMVLIDIRSMLQSMGKDIKSYPLTEIDKEQGSSHGVDREIYEE